uniref:Uncharacterized protein n=1 Tax=Glossina austeni TaxID=7395 RepID=A0A1A9UI21_GLOAU
MAVGGLNQTFNEFLCQPVSRKEYAQYGKCIKFVKNRSASILNWRLFLQNRIMWKQNLNSIHKVLSVPQEVLKDSNKLDLQIVHTAQLAESSLYKGKQCTAPETADKVYSIALGKSKLKVDYTKPVKHMTVHDLPLKASFCFRDHDG